MARKDTERYESYDKDVYDDPPQGPVGVHRGARPLSVRVAPYIIVLVAAVAAGVLFWSIFSGEAANMFRDRAASDQGSATRTSQTSGTSASSSSARTSSSSSQSSSQDTHEQDSRSPSESASATPSNTPEESQQVNMDANIAVINGTGVTGYASDRAAALQNAGFRSVTAGNPTDVTVLPGQTVVYYQNDADLATAQRVAETLGIAAVERSEGIGTPIEVVLMQ